MTREGQPRPARPSEGPGILRGRSFPARLGVEREAARGTDLDHQCVAVRDLAA